MLPQLAEGNRIFNDHSNIYVGESENLDERMKQHYDRQSDATKVASGSMRNKDGEILHITRHVFLLMTVAANHAPHTLGDGNKEPIKPWVRFGFIELLPRPDTDADGNPTAPISQIESSRVKHFVTGVGDAGPHQKGM